MAVMVPREKWTDERLDELNEKVDDGFDKVNARMFGAAVALIVATIGGAATAIVLAIVANG